MWQPPVNLFVGWDGPRSWGMDGDFNGVVLVKFAVGHTPLDASVRLL